MSALSTLSSFADFGPDDLALLDRILIERSWTTGHVFLREGARTGSVQAPMYIVLEGQVLVTTGEQTELSRLGPGDLFGHMALFDQAPRSAACSAVGAVRTAELSRATFDELQRSSAPAAALFKHLVARQLARDLRRLSDLVAMAADGDEAPLRRELGLAS
jgi:CRP/FNR family transcriptional regulator, cyclic AMP receptor protein